MLCRQHSNYLHLSVSIKIQNICKTQTSDHEETLLKRNVLSSFHFSQCTFGINEEVWQVNWE